MASAKANRSPYKSKPRQLIYRLFFLLLLLVPSTASAQFLGADWIHDDAIRSVQLYVGDDQLADPIIRMDDANDNANGSGSLTLQFDQLGTEAGTYSWQLIHCNADWTPSRLLPSEFYNGFPSDPITQFLGSRQTRVPYVHYTAQIPSATSGGSFRRSGNYLLAVLRNGSPTDTVFTKRFVVVEAAVGVQAEVALAQQAVVAADSRFQTQQVNLRLLTSALNPSDPTRELSVVILPNFRWDQLRSGLRPNYVRPGQMEYVYGAANGFAGGNEFRMLDIRSSVGRGAGVLKIDCNPTCTALLRPDVTRTNTYLTQPDLDGHFYIGSTAADRQVGLYEADYFQVQFSLRLTKPVEGDLYLINKATNWALLPDNKLRYDDATALYQALPIFKQGLYDYQYVVRHVDGSTDAAPIEGNYFETGNTYTILVYYRRFGDRADRLVGMQRVLSQPNLARD